MRLTSQLCLWLLALSSASHTLGASPHRVRLVPDGSTAPPGDRIDVSILLAPGETELTLEVRAFLVSGENNDQVKPVRARNDKYRDRDGDFLLTVPLKRENDRQTKVSSSVIIPYSKLTIELGEHQLGYDVVVRLPNDEIAFAQATPLSLVRIRETPRTTIETTVSKPRPVSRERVIDAVVIDKTTQTPRDIKIALTETYVETTKEVAVVNVRIPGSFDRDMTPDPGPDPGKTPRENYVESLKRSAWVPLRKRVVHYATNRNVAAPNRNDAARFGTVVSQTVTYGTLLANIPSVTEHNRGELKRPAWWQRRDPEKHFFVEVVNALKKQDFVNTIKGDQDILLFVHGYNNSFEDAALRLAQLAHDIRFPGKSLVFSWPSQGTPLSYGADETAAAQSVDALTEVLTALVQNGNVGRIHVVAHSMGSRVFMRSAHSLNQSLAAGARPFGHVTLVAPDIDIADFVAFLPAISTRSASTSLYFNPKDLALRASRVKHLDRRAGQSAIFIDPLENIDSLKANTSALGHTYFVQEDILLVDLQMLFNQNLRPPKRVLTLSERRTADGFTLWFFP